MCLLLPAALSASAVRARQPPMEREDLGIGQQTRSFSALQ